MSTTILVVDDDPGVRSLVREFLTGHGFVVREAASAAALDAELARARPDLVLLDLGLPDRDGLTLAQSIREQSDLPVIMVTGRRDDMDRIVGLEVGADDYVTKPFHPRELMARIRAVLRRFESAARTARRPETPRTYRFAGRELLTGSRKLKTPSGESVELTNSEFGLLMALLRNPREVLSRDRLLELSRMHDDIYDRSIDVQILRVRRKIERDPSHPELIRTERGAGYVLDCDVEVV
jgi:DNA-binding response OmpR family regulator